MARTPANLKSGGDSLFNRYLGNAYSAASRKATELFHSAKMTENLIMIVLAIIIGTLAGFGAVGIRALIREISAICYPGDGTLLENIVQAPWYYKLLLPVVGGLIVGPIIYRWAPEAKGTGVPEVMHSVLLKGGSIRPRVAFIKSLVSTITIGTGGSVGREGPIVQIGASLGSTVGQFFQIPARRMKTLVGCGAAAGIAAAFNAPIAGALFAVEIILMDYAVAQFSPIVISSVMATVISHAFEGDFPAMEIATEHALTSPWEIALYCLLGVLAGVISYLFIKVLYYFIDQWEKKLHLPSYSKACLGGLVIGLIALFFPQIMGVGYDSINLALNQESMTYMGIDADIINGLLGNQVFWIMTLLLIFIKIFATSMTLGSGGSGGIFAPSLFIGAMLGGCFGHFAHQLFPGITSSPGTYALIGMGGLVAGTTRAPITAIITIFELTKETSIILPLMVTCIIGTIVSTKFTRESIYTLKLLRRNINVRERAEVTIMKSLFVKDLYRKKPVIVPEDMPFDQIVNILISHELPAVPVRNRRGDFVGMISTHDIKDLMLERESLQDVCIAGDIADTGISRVAPADNCELVIRKMRRSNHDSLPVIDPENPRKLIGMIHLQDIVDAYEREAEQLDLTSDLADRILRSNLDKDVRFLEGYSITEFRAPRTFVGKSIRDLQIRAKFGVDILSIRRVTRTGSSIQAIPDADYRIRSGDHLVVAGKVERINLIKTLE